MTLCLVLSYWVSNKNLMHHWRISWFFLFCYCVCKSSESHKSCPLQNPSFIQQPKASPAEMGFTQLCIKSHEHIWSSWVLFSLSVPGCGVCVMGVLPVRLREDEWVSVESVDFLQSSQILWLKCCSSLCSCSCIMDHLSWFPPDLLTTQRHPLLLLLPLWPPFL